MKLILAFAQAIASVSVVEAWGWQGHGISGNLAQFKLTPIALKMVQTLLPGFTKGKLGNAASWADKVKRKPEYAWAKGLHYINPEDTPPTYCGYDKQRDCPKDCIGTGITNLTNMLNANWRAAVQDIDQGRIKYVDRFAAEQKLGRAKEPSKERHDYTEFEIFSEKQSIETRSSSALERLTGVQETLMFLIHAIGDIHQPLHATGRDKGGNQAPVKFDGKKCNLHSVWDTRMLLKRKLEFPNYMLHLQATMNKTMIRPCDKDIVNEVTGSSANSLVGQIVFDAVESHLSKPIYVCVDDWIAESNRINCDAVWKNFTYGMETGSTYFDANKEVVEMQLIRAGLRGADVLNQIFV